MLRFRYCSFFSMIVCLLSIIACGNTTKHNSEENYPSDIEKYEFLRYSGGQEIVSPNRVVQADNNWEILLSCLERKTKEELKKMEVDFTESQLMLLRAMRFIDYENDTITTTLPILGLKEKQSLTQYVRQLAQEIEPELGDEIKKLKEILTKEGYQAHIFSVLFSSVVDGIVWFPFRAQGFVSEFSLSESRPLFDGIYWAYYPKRDFRCGTNIALGDDLFVILNWSDGPQEKIQKIFNWKNLRSMHKQLVQSGRVVGEELRQRLIPYEVIDKDGNMTVPTIEMKIDDPVFPVCQSMALKIVKFMGENLDLEALQTEYGFADKEDAFVVVYHEWMWEFMEYLDEKGVVDKPLAFEKPEEAEPKDIGKLLFIVKGSIS